MVSSASEKPDLAAKDTAGEIARWSTQIGEVTVNFAFGHVRDLRMQKGSYSLQKAPAALSQGDTVTKNADETKA